MAERLLDRTWMPYRYVAIAICAICVAGLAIAWADVARRVRYASRMRALIAAARCNATAAFYRPMRRRNAEETDARIVCMSDVSVDLRRVCTAASGEEDCPIARRGSKRADGGAWRRIVDDKTRLKPQRTLDVRLRLLDKDSKRFYTEICNCLCSYGLRERFGKFKQTFRAHRRSVARLSVLGKTLVVDLAIAPDKLDARRYRHENVGMRKSGADLPTRIRVRSGLASRRVRRLIAEICQSRGIARSARYRERDFADRLSEDGMSATVRNGYAYRIARRVTLEQVRAWNDALAERLVEIVPAAPTVRRADAEVSLAAIAAAIPSGSVVDADTAVRYGLCPSGTTDLHVRASGAFSGRYRVYAREFDSDAIKMICLCGGEAYRRVAG